MDIHEQIIKELGNKMSTITFGELVKELTGLSFEEMYKDNSINGDNNVKKESDVE